MLKGRDLCIRTIRERDLEVLGEWVNDIDAQGAFLPATLTSETKLKSQYAENGFISDSSAQYLISDHAGDILGSIWVFNSVPYFDAVEVGYQIFDRQFHGKGYATEALKLFHHYLFETKQINRIELRIATENIASEQVARKVGFTHEGTCREAAYSRGKLHDMHMYAMLRSEWMLHQAES